MHHFSGFSAHLILYNCKKETVNAEEQLSNRSVGLLYELTNWTTAKTKARWLGKRDHILEQWNTCGIVSGQSARGRMWHLVYDEN